ncbi:amino acid ABC transporter substrate-binding protein [Candidatus Saccharibacteria bacterium]|nr:amino acid ABC transporter substrate-binding protein [Candidatus Saccharibacteria bacterium]
MVKKKSGSKNIKNAKAKFPLGIMLEILFLIVAIVGLGFLIVRSNKPADYIVETNAFFAPFEFYEGREIKGVDVDIINRVSEKMGKKIEIKDVEFDVIIDNVEAGKIADAGAAGLTITPARSEKVNFSIPYYNSVQYLIFDKNAAPDIRDGHIVWDAVAGKKLGSQTGSTGYLYASDEIDAGVLKDTNTIIKGFDSHQLAADAIKAHIIDYAIADELPARMIVSKNSNLDALPLYYMGATVADDYPVEESYAIAVNKERTELLEAFNEVLAEMLTKDLEGKSEIDRLVLKYMGF